MDLKRKLRSLGTTELMLVLFILSISVRLVLDCIFLFKYGPHATQQIEFWIYYGLAAGTITHSVPNPTGFIIKTLPFLKPAEGLVNSIFSAKIDDPTQYVLRFVSRFDDPFTTVLVAAAFFSAIAAVLVFLAARKCFDEPDAFISAIIFASMVQPLALSVVSFTHDLVQIPIILAIILCYFYFKKYQLLSVACSLILLYFGFKINFSVFMTIPIILCLLAFDFLKTHVKYTHLVIGFIALLALARIAILPRLIDTVFGSFAQGRTGSVDIRPITAGSAWLRYNFFWFLLPFGLWHAYKKKQFLPFVFLALGLALATLVDRGARFLDVGFALLIPFAVLNYKKEYKRYYLASVLAFALFFYYNYRLDVEFTIAFVALGLVLQFLLSKNQTTAAISLIIISSLFITHFSLKPASFNEEFSAYSFLGTMPKGKIYVKWSDGVFARAVTGFDVVSDLNYVDRELARAMWENETEGARMLSEKNVSYVAVSERDFRLTSESPLEYDMHLALIYRPASGMKFERLRELLLYRLIYDKGALANFTRIYDGTDGFTDSIVRLYKLTT